MRNAECGMKRKGGRQKGTQSPVVGSDSPSSFHSAFRIPHSALEAFRIGSVPHWSSLPERPPCPVGAMHLIGCKTALVLHGLAAVHVVAQVYMRQATVGGLLQHVQDVPRSQGAVPLGG